MLSYGLLERVTGLEGRTLLVPVVEHAGIESVARPDGIVPEPPVPYREVELLAHLRAVLAGKASWSARAALALPQEVPDTPQAPPSSCVYIISPQPGALALQHLAPARHGDNQGRDHR